MILYHLAQLRLYIFGLADNHLYQEEGVVAQTTPPCVFFYTLLQGHRSQCDGQVGLTHQSDHWLEEPLSHGISDTQRSMVRLVIPVSTTLRNLDHRCTTFYQARQL